MVLQPQKWKNQARLKMKKINLSKNSVFGDCRKMQKKKKVFLCLKCDFVTASIIQEEEKS